MTNRRLLAVVLTLVALAGLPAYAQFPAQGDDNTTSLGSFRVNIATKFQPLFANCPAYNGKTNVLQSPTLFDSQTDVGRSSPITDGSNLDVNGVAVGAANTVVGENILIPPPKRVDELAARNFGVDEEPMSYKGTMERVTA